jgi:general secretion pathway protein D
VLMAAAVCAATLLFGPLPAAAQSTRVGMDAQGTGEVVDARIQLAGIEFSRSSDGGGRLVLQFDHPGSHVDLRREGGNVVIDLGQADVAPTLPLPMEVTGYDTPVERLSLRVAPSGSRQLYVANRRPQEASGYQAGNRYIVDIAPPRRDSGEIDLGATRPDPVIRRGTGSTINQAVAATPPPALGAAGNGSATFNFEGESLQAVVKAILGDMLGQNYVIGPGVQGTVTLATPKPVSPAQALNLLEMVLGWNNARMVYSGGRYNIVPADQALAGGTVAPATAPASSARGFEARVVPLKYISAAEMKKVLEPYARPNAIVNVDSGRNVITVAGTRAELENYLRTIQIFDVDWMSSMSVGVFPLQSSRAAQIAGDLEKVFGEQSKSPVAGMFRFMPLEGANAVLAITSQPLYLDQIRQWIERIEDAGSGTRLYSYELQYITAKDLAQRLAEVYGSSGGQGGGSQASLMPGAQSSTLDSSGSGGDASSALQGDRSLSSDSLSSSSGSSLGSSDSSSGGLGSGSLQLGPRTGGNASVTLEVDGDRVGVSAVDETNTLLVRSSGQAWRSIREVIARLDVMPLQVHIEAQVVEVTLTGELSYGVSWFLRNVDGSAPDVPDGVGGRSLQPVSSTGTGGLLYSFGVGSGVGVLSALDRVSKIHMLQSPSVTVRNNYEASFTVGSRIPISSVTVNTGSGTDNSYSTVQYIDTGTILKVRPRVTREGTVFLDVVQEVSSPGSEEDDNGNVRINNRKLKTNAVISSGETVLLAGLIQDTQTKGSSGFPGLSRIPLIGGLFGQQTSSKERSEVVVLLTPTLVRDPGEARRLTDEFSERFQSLRPLREPKEPQH